MAKIIDSNVQSRTLSDGRSEWKIVIVGAVLGLLHWCLASLISKYTNSTTIPSDVATILVAVFGLIAMVRLLVARPIVVVLASAASLWGLTLWTSGLGWVEAIAWSTLLYGLSYTLFSWLARYMRTVPVLILVITIVVLARITATL